MNDEELRDDELSTDELSTDELSTDEEVTEVGYHPWTRHTPGETEERIVTNDQAGWRLDLF